MEFINSNRGSSKLCYEGYTYTKKKQSKTTITWECSQRRSMGCKGALITDFPATEVRSTREHQHDVDRFAVAAMKVREEINECVDANRGQPGQIIADKMVSQPVEVRLAAGTTETIKRGIRRKRAGATPGNPSLLKDIPIPLPKPYDKQLIYDNESSTNRVLVFASDEGLGLLQEADSWFMDGTHSTAPQQFKQVFTVRVLLGETSATTVYALLPSKTQDVYEECLTAVLDACLRRNIRPNPTKIVCDYELAIHNAVQSVLAAGINIQGCFYHLTQSTWRQMQQDGLQTLYREEEDVRHFCGQLDGLAFLPEEEVKTGMAHLREIAPDALLPILEYFDSNYVSEGFRSVRTETGALKFRRTQPRFDIARWNVHAATLTGSARTNNVCESWNNGFRSLVGHLNPSLWTIILCFEKDAAMVQTEILRVQRGQPSKMPVRRGTVRHQRTLKTLCEHRVTGTKTIAEFLDAIGRHIRLH